MREDLTSKTSGRQLARLLAIAVADGPSEQTDGEPPLRQATGESVAECQAADTEPGPFEIGQELGELRILEEIGRGGMCIVYKAYEKTLKRTVALKALRPSLTHQRVVAERFGKEAVLAANLNHASIVPIFAHSLEPDGTPYFTMELVQGRSVRQKVGQDGPVDPAKAARIALDASEALHYAHESNIIHRDVTPRNILLQEPDERVRITDFGIAQDITGRLADATQTGSSAGTPAYMSPEQNLCRQLDRRTDIYSLGMTLYYMLTGEAAYQASGRAELALAFAGQKPRPPSAISPAVPKALDRIVMKMIAVDQRERHQDCRQAAAELRAFLAEAQTSRPARSERHRWVMPTAAAAVGVLVLAAAVAGWLLIVSSADRTFNGAGDGPGVESGAELPPTGPPPARATDANQGPGRTADIAANKAAIAAAPATVEKAASPLPPIVHWVYQPDPGKSFDDTGAVRGRVALEPGGLHSGMYLFRAGEGLTPYTGPTLEKFDFRVAVEDGKLAIIRDAPGEYAGCIATGGPDQFWDADPPITGYRTYYQHELADGMVLLFRCAKGGHAKFYVGPDPPARPAPPAGEQYDPNLPMGVVK